MHVDQVFGSGNLCQERFSINHLRLFLEVHRVIHVHVYMYTSRVQSKPLRRLDPVGIIYRLARNDPALE